jgi:hypothetical protein
MRYSVITSSQRRLREGALYKEGGAISKAVGGVVKAPLKMMWGAAQRAAPKGPIGKVVAPVIAGAGILGVGAAGASAIGKARQHNRGFDPRIMQASRGTM